MLMAVEKNLIQTKCFTAPVVFIKSEVDKATGAKIKEIIRRRQGTITEQEEEATHVIYPVVDPLQEEYARPCYRRDGSVLLHWYYFPDSYDSWVPLDLPWEYPENVFAISNMRFLVF